METAKHTATVVLEYVWTIPGHIAETSTYTTPYTNTPGVHTVYAAVYNSKMDIRSQSEIVAAPITLQGGHEIYTLKQFYRASTHLLPAAEGRRSERSRWRTR